MTRSRAVTNEQGFALNVVLPLIGLLAIVSMILPELYVSSKQRTVDARRLIEMRNVAQNLKELGKYMILYERVVFKDNPLNRDVTKIKAQQDLWPQAFGMISNDSSNHMLNACGGYDALANFIGTLTLGGEPVFCPMYVRNSQMTGKMLEDMVFEKWATGGATQSVSAVNGQVVTSPATMNKILEGTEGKYSVEFTMDDALRAGGDQMLDPVFDNELRRQLKVLDAKAKIKLEFYSDSFGFGTEGNNRYVKVTATVDYGPLLARRQVYDQETFVLYTPTIKDFALFVPYPLTSAGAATTRSSQAINFGGKNTKIYGRVYFNGDIDNTLDTLPTFYETVVISGRLIPGNSEVSPSDYDKIRDKFRKGIVTGFSAPKYVMDGQCGMINGTRMDVANQTGLYCLRDGNPFSIQQYIYNLGICTDFPVTVTGQVTVNYTPNPRGITDPSGLCPSPGADKRFVRGGWQSVTLNSSTGFIASPVRFFRSNTQADIYGVIMGGNIQLVNGTTLRSIPYMAAGQPGIGTALQLQTLNTEANSIVEGITAPLTGFPLIQAAKQGMN